MQNPSEYLKNKMIKRLLRNHMKQLEFIEQTSPEHFLFILCSSNEASDESIIKCFNEVADEVKHFAIYNLSRTRRWNLVETEIKKYLGKQ